MVLNTSCVVISKVWYTHVAWLAEDHWLRLWRDSWIDLEFKNLYAKNVHQYLLSTSRFLLVSLWLASSLRDYFCHLWGETEPTEVGRGQSLQSIQRRAEGLMAKIWEWILGRITSHTYNKEKGEPERCLNWTWAQFPASTLASSQLPVTPGPGDPTPSSGLYTHAHTCACTHTPKINTDIHIKKI